MKVRTNTVRFAALALVTVALSGCGMTVSRNESLNTAFGPGQSPTTYRVGGERPESESGSRVTLIRSADVSSGWKGAATAPAAAPASGAAPAAPASGEPTGK